MKNNWPLIAILALCLVAGCAPATKIMLLPDPDGKVGVVAVSAGGVDSTLDAAWQTAEVSRTGRMPATPRLMDKKEAEAMFKEALAAEPVRPATMIVYFKSESSALSAEAFRILTLVLAEIKARASTDIIVSGHTDAAGSVGVNKALSLKRARVVADYLVSQGVNAEYIQITYHGKGNPLIATPDGVSEPRNRRVEITVR